MPPNSAPGPIRTARRTASSRRGTPCGSGADTVCDNPDTCDAGGACQSNYEPSTTECRADAGECDVAESCDGVGNCPVDGFEPSGTPCGSGADTVCDNPDTCDAEIGRASCRERE